VSATTVRAALPTQLDVAPIWRLGSVDELLADGLGHGGKGNRHDYVEGLDNPPQRLLLEIDVLEHERGKSTAALDALQVLPPDSELGLLAVA